MTSLPTHLPPRHVQPADLRTPAYRAVADNTGLLTSTWGPSGWDFLHAVTFAYPVQPTPTERATYRQWWEGLAAVLPCPQCRRHFGDLLRSYRHTGHVLDVERGLQSRADLVAWLFAAHQDVSQRLGKAFDVTLADVVAKYESYRVVCPRPVTSGVAPTTVDGAAAAPAASAALEASAACWLQVDERQRAFRYMYSSAPAFHVLALWTGRGVEWVVDRYTREWRRAWTVHPEWAAWVTAPTARAALEEAYRWALSVWKPVVERSQGSVDAAMGVLRDLFPEAWQQRHQIVHTWRRVWRQEGGTREAWDGDLPHPVEAILLLYGSTLACPKALALRVGAPVESLPSKPLP